MGVALRSCVTQQTLLGIWLLFSRNIEVHHCAFSWCAGDAMKASDRAEQCVVAECRIESHDGGQPSFQPLTSADGASPEARFARILKVGIS